jgi:hypothetical protein
MGLLLLQPDRKYEQLEYSMWCLLLILLPQSFFGVTGSEAVICFWLKKG